MAWYTTLQPKHVGLVEIFKNPLGREWRDLKALADPIDGIRGYVIDGDLYCWGSLPLHRDLRAALRLELPTSSAWIGVQVAPLLCSVTITEVTESGDRTIGLAEVKTLLAHNLPLIRLLGGGFTLRCSWEAEAASLVTPKDDLVAVPDSVS